MTIPDSRAGRGELGMSMRHLPNEKVWPLLSHIFTSVKTLLLGTPQAQYGPPALHPSLTGKQPMKDSVSPYCKQHHIIPI